MPKELQENLLRLLRLVNGLLAITYLSGFAWLLAQVYKIFI